MQFIGVLRKNVFISGNFACCQTFRLDTQTHAWLLCVYTLALIIIVGLIWILAYNLVIYAKACKRVNL